jgi:hypothetical protein
MTTYPVRTRRWTRAEYDRLIDVGVFLPDEPLEFLGGELVVSEPQGSAHYTAIGLLEDAPRAALEPGWLVRSEGPLELDVNLVDRVVEIYRRPVPDPSVPFGWRYASREVLSAESSVELLEVAGARILVSDLLP